MQGKKNNTGPGKIGLGDLKKYEIIDLQKYEEIDSVRLNKYPKYDARQGERKTNQWIMKYRSSKNMRSLAV